MPSLPILGPILQQWWKNLGFGQQLILFLQITVRFTDRFFVPLLNKLYNQTRLVQNGDYWRLFTAPLFSVSYIETIIKWLLFQLIVNPYETTVGSTYFIFDFFFKSFVLESVNFLVNFGLSQYDTNYQYTFSYGISGLTMYYLCSKLLASPYSKSNFYLFQITNYYLLVTIPLATFLSTQKLIFIFAFQIAIFEWFFFDGMLIRLSNNSIEKLSQIFGQFKNKNCYKQPSQSLQEPKLFVESAKIQEGIQKEAVQEFGGRGITIGTDQEVERQWRAQGQNNYQQI
ncbi:unnamed protein product [Paramecium pentaurelia]|uniref:Derlin n=1 Tax=Paramecium pentaurelia TaxID=43138 RepID=A0A8S1TV19_9CILI|nr:unnamed protein product [Paramecium pentaurelia]